MSEPFIPDYLKQWKRPANYMGATWEGYYCFLGQHRDSEALTRSDFSVGLERLNALPDWEPPETPDDEDEPVSRVVVNESHWAVGWVEWICIHPTDEVALRAADEMKKRVDDGEALSSEDLCNRVEKEAAGIWKDCYSWKERITYMREKRGQFEFHDWQDMLKIARGEYFGGDPLSLVR